MDASDGAPRPLDLAITPSGVDGAFVLDVDSVEDDRGFFARTFDADQLAAAGLESTVAQASVSFNRRAGTLRGIHVQREPHGETKLVRCTAGRIFDVTVDLRASSPNFGAWVGYELTAVSRRALYIPRGCGHGFVTLDDDVEVTYLMSTRFVADASAGMRWDDPTVAIDWPVEPTVISDRDQDLPPLSSFA